MYVMNLCCKFCFQGMKSDSNDVKQLIGNVVELVSRVANQTSSDGIDESTAKVWIPTLILGTKEKNSAVKAFSEYALITLLQLRRSDEVYKVSRPRKSVVCACVPASSW